MQFLLGLFQIQAVLKRFLQLIWGQKFNLYIDIMIWLESHNLCIDYHYSCQRWVHIDYIIFQRNDDNFEVITESICDPDFKSDNSTACILMNMWACCS